MLLNKLIAVIALIAISFVLPVSKSHVAFAMPEVPDAIRNQLYDLGVIDRSKVAGELSALNMFWALGLANKNEILEKGPMMDSKYGGAGNFASTGGWTLAKGSAMDHYSMHSLVTLSPDQQKMVEEVSKNIFRPCCRNPVYFPDCNHGMAMLGILELKASQGANESELYAISKQVNDVWFPPVEQKNNGGCSV